MRRNMLRGTVETKVIGIYIFSSFYSNTLTFLPFPFYYLVKQKEEETNMKEEETKKEDDRKEEETKEEDTKK